MRSICKVAVNRKGIAMLAAVGVLFVIGLFAIQFHRMSREAQLNAYKFQASEVARQLAESAMDEAFTYVYNQTAKSDTDLFKAIVSNSTTPSVLDCTSGSLEDKNLRGTVIPVPLTVNVATSMNVGNRFVIEVMARIIDFRNSDDTGRKFYGNEGVGTLELRARVEPSEKFRKNTPGACSITRHHDYKVVSIVSKRSLRPASYVQNRLLDYALLITRGREEFEQTSGSNLNPQETKIVIDQNGFTPSSSEFYGKIYLGGTSGTSGKPVFIDVTTETKDFIPEPRQKDNISPPSPIDNADSLSLVTSIYPLFNSASKQAFDEELSKQGKTGDAKYKYCQITGIQGNFFLARYPTTDEAIDAIPTLTAEQKTDMKIARKGAWQIPDIAYVPKDPALPFTPGLRILPLDKLESIIQGKIRKRFFHFGYVVLDMTNAEISVIYEYKKPKLIGYSWKTGVAGPNKLNDPVLIDKYKARQMPCYPNIETLRGGEVNIEFLAGKFPDPLLTSKFISEYDYLPGTEKDKFPSPAFYEFSTPKLLDGTDLATNEFRPFSHASLWIRRDFPADRLAEYGIYQNGELHLRGIIRVHGSVNLKGNAGTPLKVFGQGILIADEIVIESGITKGDADALCILAVRGATKDGNISNQTIWVKTDEKIEASLIAVGYGHGCRVVPENNKLNLFGALAVDKLDINRWKKAVEHKVSYDPMLACDKDLYQVNLSRWISFNRMIESDN